MRSLLIVCDLVPKKYGSFERFLVCLGGMCRKRGIRLGLLLAGKPVPAVAEAFAANGINWRVIERMRESSMLRRRRSLSAAVLNEIRAGQWDVLAFHFCDELSVLATCLLGRLMAPQRFSVIWEHHSEVRGGAGWRKWFSRLMLLRLVVDRFVSVSRQGADALAARLHSGHAITCIYNGITIPSNPRRGWLRQELGLPPNAVLMVNVGGLIPLKAQDLLINAAAPLLNASSDRHLLIIGGGPLKETLEAQARSAGVQDRVHLLGIRNDVPDVLADSDLFVLPSHTEALPFAVIEAMAAGLPAVATRVGGLADLVSDQETGLLVPPADVHALRAALSALLNNPELSRRYGEAGRQKAERLFDLDQAVERRLSLYESVHRSPNDRAAFKVAAAP